MANSLSQGKKSNGGVAKKRISSSIFLALKTSDNEEENTTMEHNFDQMTSNRNQVQTCALFYTTNNASHNDLMPAMSRSDEFRRSFDRRSNRARSPSPRSAVALNRKDERPPKASRPRRIPNRSRSIDARKKADQSLRTWQQTSSAPSCCCEDETKIWHQFRRRLLSNEHTDERHRHFRQLESRTTNMSEKSCYIYNIVKTRAENTLSPKTYRPNTSALAVEEGYELRTSSLGRKTRAGVKPCAAQEPLIESIKTLNGLAEGLHAEAKSIRGEISELYDRFDDPNVTDRDCEKRKQLLELSKYVKILEYRLQQAQRIDQLKVESEQNARLEDELNRIRKRAESDQKENRELYLQIISLRTSERALKDENRRLNNRLDQLSLHGTQVNEPKANNLDEEVQKETNLLQAEISVMRDSLSEVTKLNSDLKEKLILYQLKYGESDGYSTDRDMSYHLTEKTHETQVLAQKVNQLEQDKADLHQKLECIQNSDTEFLEEEMLILQSTVKELEIENSRLKQLTKDGDISILQKELSRLKTENANLRSGVQTKIQLKSAIRSMLQDKSSIRSSISERSFIVRRGIFELLPVLSVREEVYRVQRLSNKLLSALRRQQKMEIPYSAISAEARALAAETALLVKKYGVLEEQVQTLIKELKQVQRTSPTHMLKTSDTETDEIIV